MTVNDDSVTAQDTQDRARQDSEVKRKRPVVHVPDIASQSSSQGVSLRPWTCAQPVIPGLTLIRARSSSVMKAV
jgi:hypothetical protein